MTADLVGIWSVCVGGQSSGIEPQTGGILCYLHMDNVRIELNCRIPAGDGEFLGGAGNLPPLTLKIWSRTSYRYYRKAMNCWNVPMPHSFSWPQDDLDDPSTGAFPAVSLYLEAGQGPLFPSFPIKFLSLNFLSRNPSLAIPASLHISVFLFPDMFSLRIILRLRRELGFKYKQCLD